MRNGTTMTIPAGEIREGDFIPGLDNAYVPWPPQVDEYKASIIFHDAEGGEGELSCHPDMPVTIERKD